MKKNKILGMLLFVSFLLLGCGNSGESGGHYDKPEPDDSTNQSPPTLKLIVGDKIIPTFLGSRNWSYYDSVEKAMVGIEAETIPPFQMVSTENAEKVDGNAAAKLKFENPPLSYQVFVWDKAGSQNSIPGNFDLSNHQGQTIFEIYANWKQGNASYVFVLDIE